ncbi:MAG: putative O-acetyl-ADP-ribose deacetylase, partial [Streblomastix strix]
KVTKGYNLPSKTVIHTVGPIYYKDPEGAEVKLRSCYRRCLEICDEHHFHSIAFCLVSCGIYGYPVKEGAQVSQDVVTEYLNRNPNTSLTDIVFTVFSNADAEIFHQVFDRNVKKEKDGLKEGKVDIEQKKQILFSKIKEIYVQIRLQNDKKL